MSAEQAVADQGAGRSSGFALWLGRYFRRLTHGQLRLELPGGNIEIYQGEQDGPTATLRVARPYRLLRRVALRGEIGFAEAFIEGDWHTDDLPSLLDLLFINLDAPGSAPKGMALSRHFARLMHRLRPNSRRGSRRNIARHYDLGNDFYRLWLDDSMTYSCAVFDDLENEPMIKAQQRKYARLLDALQARPGQHILEVGCGWGGFAELAARRGHRVTAITLSRAQLDYARERIERAGLADRVELRLQDYREVSEQFDHVVSIEMIEAVGEAYWPTFFRALARLTRPGGRIALQGITIDEDAFAQYRRQADFIQLYIFPGGMLMPPDRLGAEAEGAGLRLLARSFFGRHYAETLKRWHRSFALCGEKLRELGYDRRFQRMWMYYLAYCEVGFLRGRVDLMHAVLERPGPCPQPV